MVARITAPHATAIGIPAAIPYIPFGIPSKRFDNRVRICDACGGAFSMSVLRTIPLLKEDMSKHWEPKWAMCYHCYINAGQPQAAVAQGRIQGYEEPTEPDRTTVTYIQKGDHDFAH